MKLTSRSFSYRVCFGVSIFLVIVSILRRFVSVSIALSTGEVIVFVSMALINLRLIFR